MGIESTLSFYYHVKTVGMYSSASSHFRNPRIIDFTPGKGGGDVGSPNRL